MSIFGDSLEELLAGLAARARQDEAKPSAERARALKETYLKNRETVERLKEEGSRALPGAAAAVVKMIDRTVRDLIPLATHPFALASPLSGALNSSVEKLRSDLRAVVSIAPRALAARDSSAAIGAVVDLFNTLDTIVIGQLPLIYRDEVPDYFHGLDEEACFPGFRYSASGRGRAARIAGAAPKTSCFSATNIGGMIWASPVAGRNGDIYIGHAGGEFVALAPDGSAKWRVCDPRMSYVAATGALGDDGYLYMASCDSDPSGNLNRGRVWKIDPDDGSVEWAFEGAHYEDPRKDPHAHLASMFEASLALNVENGGIFIYAGCNDGWLYKIGSDGSLAWEYDTESYPTGMIKAKPLVSPDGRTVFIATLSGWIHAIDVETGLKRWMIRVGGGVVSSPATGMYGEIFFGCLDGKIYALDPGDGAVFWTYQTLGLIHSSPAVAADGGVVIGSADGGVYCLDRFGARRWVYFTDAPVKSSPTIDPNGLIYVGNDSGKLYCIDADGRRVWSIQTAPPPEKALNGSPVFGAGGAILVGSSTGDLFTISPDYCKRGKKDARVSVDPGSDSASPEVPAGGEIIVPLDSFGAPRFGADAEIGISDNVCLAVFAADENREIVPAEIDPRTLKVEVEPELKCEVRVDAAGCCVNLIPKCLMEYNTSYRLRISGRYVTCGGAREFEREVSLKTYGRKRGGMPLKISRDACPAMVLKNFALCRPKEINAVSEAAVGALNFAVAPVYMNNKSGVMVVVGCGVTGAGGEYEFAPKSVNKWVASGFHRDGWFRVSGDFRIVAQGANVLFDKFLMSGRFTKEPGIESGSAFGSASIHNMPDFVDLFRTMRLADANDEIAGFMTFGTLPFGGAAARRPQGIEIEMKSDFDRVVAIVNAPDYQAEEHWIQFVMVDTEMGALVRDNRVEVLSGERGNLIEVNSTVPVDARKGATAAILVFDLFPVAVVEI
jgi:outer membrane protein assembly factor BamB